jgi:hypothetical protein
MNHKLKLIGLLTIGAGVGLMLAVFQARYQMQAEVTLPNSSRVIRGHGLYATFTHDEMIDQSDVIFLGEVVNISSTKWNQDSGAPWSDKNEGLGLPLHSIDLEVLQPIVDTLGLGKHVTLTVVGTSPLDGGQVDYDLKAGEQAIIFAVQRELAWRGGTRSVLRLVNAPQFSYFKLEDNGLYAGLSYERAGQAVQHQSLSIAQLIQQIAQRRATLIQP